MSMSRGCLVVEREIDEWYCVVARDEYDYDFENYSVYGPAKTEDAALDLMSASECNPGSFNTITHNELTPAVAKMIDDELRAARRIMRRRYS